MDKKLIKIMKFIEEEIGLDVCEVTNGNYVIDSADFVIDIKDLSEEDALPQDGGQDGK